MIILPLVSHSSTDWQPVGAMHQQRYQCAKGSEGRMLASKHGSNQCKTLNILKKMGEKIRPTLLLNHKDAHHALGWGRLCVNITKCFYTKKKQKQKTLEGTFLLFLLPLNTKKIGSIRVTLINWRLATVISSHLQVFKIKHRIRGSFFTVFLKSSSFKFMLAALTNVAAYMSSQHRQGARQRQGPLCSICGLKSKREAVRCTNASQREVSSVL